VASHASEIANQKVDVIVCARIGQKIRRRG
jgi:hypothetical protein